MKRTPEEFIHWLTNELSVAAMRPGGFTPLESTVWIEIQEVEAGESQRVSALAEHEKFQSWLDAGFTETQAFALLLNDRKAMWQAVARDHRDEKDNDK